MPQSFCPSDVLLHLKLRCGTALSELDFQLGLQAGTEIISLRLNFELNHHGVCTLLYPFIAFLHYTRPTPCGV